MNKKPIFETHKSLQNYKNLPLPNFNFIKEISALNFVDRIILYGSRARGDHKERSDIDIAIDCNKANENDWLTVLNILDRIETLLKIDCVRYDTLMETNPLKKSIDKEGLILYSKEQEMNEQIELSFSKLHHALNALEAMVVKPMQEDRSNVDACIQRFEFTIELFWKLLKRILFSLGEDISYPREILKVSFKGKLINNEQVWLQMLQDRNQTSHTYDDDLADKIYFNIKNYFPLLKASYEELKLKFPSSNSNP